MKTLTGLLTILSCVFAFLSIPALAAETPDAKITALISHVENLKDAKFIRNGSEYDAKSAAKFLQGKWGAKKKEIHTPQDFIKKVGTASGTTGKPYLIRFKDGKQTPCATYLTEQLAKMENARE